MPDYRTHAQVAERGDVDFHKRPDPLRENRRKWIWLAGIVGLWPLFWQILGHNDQTIYWSHTLSNSHQIVQDNCQKCHLEWCQTFRMKIMSPAELRVVEANTCQTCHWEDTRDHNEHMVLSQAQGCFDCHAEHRHKASLNDVANVYCTACHRDLRIDSDGAAVSSPSFVASIGSFADHPEFQIRRAIDAKGRENLMNQKNHQAPRLAIPPDGPDMDDSETSWDWKDNSQIHFNHKKHLLGAGAGIPATHPLNAERAKKGLEPLPTKQLSCSDCHERDDAGEYFRPINYERHCSACHELSFSEELNKRNLAEAGSTPLPHEKPEIIRGTLRDRLTTFINNHPERLKPDEARQNPLPFKTQVEPLPTFQQKADWVESQLARMELVVQGLNGEAEANYRTIQRGCAKCHVIQPNPKSEGVNWDVRPPKIPERWLPHSRFRHDRHDMLECYDCHYTRAPEEPRAGDFRSDPGSIFQSDEARDLLMPSIANCRSCHGSPVGWPIPGRVKARDDCTECHAYHHTLTTNPELREAWDRSDGIGDVENRLWRQREVPISREQLLRNLPTE